MRARALIFASLWMLAIQQPAPEVVIVSPAPETMLRGSTVLEAEVKPPGTVVAAVTFYVNGTQVCVVKSAPFRCTWDVGSDPTSRDIRVVAQLAGGARPVRTLRTAAGGPTYHVTNDSLMVSAHVRDRNGRFIRGLDVTQFQLFEDNMPQSIGSFATGTTASELVLALDVSGSMTPALEDLRTAAGNFLRTLRPIDSVTVATFNTELFINSPRGTPLEARLAALESLRAGGGTAFYDAIIESTEILRASPHRRAVIVFTDGEDVWSRASAAGAQLALQTSDVVLYVIAQGKAATDRAVHQRVEQLCLETGGAAFFASHMADLGKHFSEILDELTNEYQLFYTPTRPFGDGGRRTIMVKMSDPSLQYQVRHRGSYMAVPR